MISGLRSFLMVSSTGAPATSSSFSKRPEDRGVFQLQSDVPAEVQEGDFMWLRAFCHKPATPAARVDSATCFKDVNRHASLSRQFAS